MLECYRSGGGDHRAPTNLIKSDNCAESGLICSEETGKARCVFEAPRCAEKPGVGAVCVGDVKARCEADASHPLPGVKCSGDAPHCVESEESARCSPFPELCSEDDPDRCVSERISSCVDQIWLAPSDSGFGCFGECGAEGAMQCVETTPASGKVPVYVAVCSAGIWRPAGPACPSSCSCADAQSVCRCQD